MFESWEAFQARSLLGLSPGRWAALLGTAAGVFLALYLARRILRKRLGQRAARTGSPADTYLSSLLRRTWTVTLAAAALLVALSVVPVPPMAGAGQADPVRVARTVALLALFVQLGRWGTSLIDDALAQGFRLARFRESTAQTALGVVRFFALAALWTSVAILGLSAVGVEVTPLLAGLGVGGIAIGFALQRILGDIFCSVAIVLDRPFEVGDLIQTGDYQGTIERIGIKTTRMRGLGGEQVIFANSDLIQSRIRNYSRMTERRVVFRFGVPSGTPAAAVERIPGLVRQLVEDRPKTRFERAHLVTIGESSLSFEVAYVVLDADATLAMDIQQAINLGLLAALEGLGAGPPSSQSHRDVAEPAGRV